MIGEVKELSEENLMSFVLEKQHAVVLFDAPWNIGSGPYVQQKMLETASELGERINFGKINTDCSPDICKYLHILNVPIILYFKKGEVVKRIYGADQDIKSVLVSIL